MDAILKAGGRELIGTFVVQKHPFKTVGQIVDYHKVKDKGAGKNTKIGGQYLLSFGKGKRFWRTWGDLDINWEIKQIYQSAYENGNHDYSVNGFVVSNCPSALAAFKIAFDKISTKNYRA